MSWQLPAVDLSAAQVGTTGTLDWSSANPSAAPQSPNGPFPSLLLYNESGCGLSLNFIGMGSTDFLPAGGWRIYPVKGGITSATWTVSYVLPSAPVTQLIGVYFNTYEQPPNTPGILGNSPVGIGGSVQTVGTQTLQNDGSAPATQVIEMTPSDQTASSVKINNDASGFLQVLSAGVLRSILNVVRGNATTGKASIVIGDAGDTSILTVHGTADNASSVPVSGIGNGTLPSGVTVPAANVSGTVNYAGALIAPQNGNGVAVYYDSAAGQYGLYPAELSNTSAGLAGYGWSGSVANYAWKTGGDGGFYVSQYLQLPFGAKMHAISFFSGTGAGTFNHGLGTTPLWVGITTTEANSTETVGVDTITSTSVHVNQGATGWPWIGVAIA